MVEVKEVNEKVYTFSCEELLEKLDILGRIVWVNYTNTGTKVEITVKEDEEN